MNSHVSMIRSALVADEDAYAGGGPLRVLAFTIKTHLELKED